MPAAGFADNDDWGNSAAQAESGQDSYYSGNQPLQRTGSAFFVSLEKHPTVFFPFFFSKQQSRVVVLSIACR